ncbi:MAG: putative quinol monooxygenase [Alphaproteobacteria bacterium]|nr:putative quinol monooxygenase [Alphaproteobacteria bacterium]
MTGTLKIVARMIIAPERRNDVVPEMLTLVEDTRREPGCLQYDLLQGVDEPNVMVFVEEWESRELWEEHMNGAALRAFNQRVRAGAFANGEVHPVNQIA